jgi:hypothetical protein
MFILEFFHLIIDNLPTLVGTVQQRKLTQNIVLEKILLN